MNKATPIFTQTSKTQVFIVVKIDRDNDLEPHIEAVCSTEKLAEAQVARFEDHFHLDCWFHRFDLDGKPESDDPDPVEE
jgi:hypothetical protein